MPTTDAAWWTALSDHDLAFELKKLGMPAPAAVDWVCYRDASGAAEQLERMLKRTVPEVGTATVGVEF